MDPLPSPDERGWLVEAMAHLIGQRGAAPFVDAPIVDSTPAYFPEPWRPDGEGAGALCRRLLAYAGLELGVEVEVRESLGEIRVDDRGNTITRHAGASAWFAGIRGDVARFDVDHQRLAEPAAVAGTMCHEVARAYRHAHGLVVDSRDTEERLADVTAVYLGFGVLSAAPARLSPKEMAFLLALQVAARGVPTQDDRRIERALDPDRAASYRAARAYLRERPEAVALLELPGAQPEHLVALVPSPVANLGRRAKRQLTRTDPRAVAAATTLGLAIGAIVALVVGLVGVAGLLAPAMAGGGVLGLGLGYARARRGRFMACDACGVRLARGVAACPGCGAAMIPPRAREAV